MVWTPTDNPTRRDIVKAAGAAGAVGLTGCIDGGEEEPEDNETGDGDGEEGRVLNWHAGGEGGTYYPLSGQFKTIVDGETDYSLQVQSTGASVENVGSLGDESADFALIQNDVAYFAKEGTGLDAFEGEPVENLLGVATLYPETIHIITQPDSEIETISDMEGMSVNTGDLGSGTQVNALQILESVAGLTPEDFDEQNTSFSGAADQIRDGDIDASFIVGGWPVGAVEDLATTTDIEILNLASDAREAAMEDASWFAEDTIPAGTYEGIDEDVNTVSVQAMIATHENIEADVVESVTNAIFDNVDELTLKTDFINSDTALDGMSIDLHEGAERVFGEM